MTDQKILDYIIAEEAAFKTTRIPITNSKDWNMYEHIQRCTNVANAWFHSGQNDGLRPYDDIVTPILNVAIRSEGFDVKDIIPYIDNPDLYYKSFLIKKYHPQWARRNGIDTFIDDVVESQAIYGLSLIKDVKNARPECTPLQEVAFCDQTDVLSAPICLKHQFSPSDLQEYRGKWDDNKIDEAIMMMEATRTSVQADGKQTETPGKYLPTYELNGMLPESWLKDGGDPNKYVDQMHVVTYYTSKDDSKHPIVLFKGKNSRPKFKALKIDRIKSFGKACGRGLIESLFEPQVWANYDAIQIKKLLDAAALNLYQTASKEYQGQKLSNLKTNTILGHELDKPISRIDTQVPNITPFDNHSSKIEGKARTIGSAQEAQLGEKPDSGTPFALQALVVHEGQGIHEYNQGKIATFFADELYPDWILKYLVEEMNSGKEFSEDLSFDELTELATTVTHNEIDRQIKENLLKTGKVTTEEERQTLRDAYRKQFISGGSRKFFKTLKGELDKIPTQVFINIKGKQKNMARNADGITNIIREVIRNPQAFTQIPGIGKAFNQLIEESGFSPIDFAPIITDVKELQPNPASLSKIAPAEDKKAVTA